jgi:hypothetical protein
MVGNVKDVRIRDLTTATDIVTTTADFVGFEAGWVYLLDESIDKRTAYSWGRPSRDKIIVSPKGIAYPGDTVPGSGAKKIVIDLVNPLTSVTMTQVEDVDITTGWVVITKGDHVIAYSPAIINFLTVEPTP